MDVPRFSGEDDRRRFYGEDARPPPPRQFELGREWRVSTEPGVLYALRWVEDTHEILAIRQPQPQAPVDDDLLSSSWPLPVGNMDFGAQLLGWAESLEVLEEALAGWQLQMAEDDSLEWVRARLADAAAQTEHQPRNDPPRWWPGSRRSR